MRRSEEVRTAVIGSGKMAAVHARNIAATPGARLVAVAGGSGASELAAHFGASTLSVDDAFSSPHIDAVVIASPNRFHAEHVAAAAAGGKAVLVEKPVDLDIERVDACIRAVGDGAGRVVVAFNRRFDPSFAGVRARIAGGEIGEVEQVVIVSRDPAPPPLEYVPGSGGLFRDMTIHDLDMARFVVGDISTVHASTQAAHAGLAELGDFSGAIVSLTAETGALVSIHNARSNAFGYDQRLEAFGPLGTLGVENASSTMITSSGAAGVSARDQVVSHYSDRYREAYAAEIAHLVAVTRGEVAPRASLADGRAALRLANAAAESARTGRAVAVST